MPRSLRKKTKEYALDRFQEEDPVEYFKYKTKSTYGLTMDQMDIIQAVENQSVQKVRSMLNRGVDPNFVIARTQQTPLHLAVENKGGSDAACEKILGVLLFFGANPNAQDHDGYSSLHLACKFENAVAVELLLQAGADVNIVDSVYVLHLLSSDHINKSNSVRLNKDRHCFVKTLLKQALYVNTIDEKGLSPLCYEILLLLKSNDSVPWMLDTAKVLVCGGAELHLPQDFDELESFIKRAITVPAANLFSRLVDDIQHVIPHAQSKLLKRLEQKANFSLSTSMLTTSDKEVEPLLSLVPSLTQLCRITIRQCLSGYVYANVKFLPVPDKMKEYICSCD